MSPEALKPCPFCGGAGQIREDDRTFFASCTSADCFCAVGEGYDRSAMPAHMWDNRFDAVAAWNRRALPPPPIETGES